MSYKKIVLSLPMVKLEGDWKNELMNIGGTI